MKLQKYFMEKQKSSKAEKTALIYLKTKNQVKILPTKKILKKDIEKGLKLLELLVNANIMNSKSEARRAINNNGIKINDLLCG